MKAEKVTKDKLDKVIESTTQIVTHNIRLSEALQNVLINPDQKTDLSVKSIVNRYILPDSTDSLGRKGGTQAGIVDVKKTMPVTVQPLKKEVSK